MNPQKSLFIYIFLIPLLGYAQENKKRLDFAKMYLELSGTYIPSFEGKRILQDGETNTFTHGASILPSIGIGGFHFWKHAEFYVTAPFKNIHLNGSEVSYDFLPVDATGFRVIPRGYQKSKLSPYYGISITGLTFRQRLESNSKEPFLNKYILSSNLGLLYGSENLAGRINLNLYIYKKMLK